MVTPLHLVLCGFSFLLAQALKADFNSFHKEFLSLVALCYIQQCHAVAK